VKASRLRRFTLRNQRRFARGQRKRGFRTDGVFEEILQTSDRATQPGSMASPGASQIQERAGRFRGF